MICNDMYDFALLFEYFAVGKLQEDSIQISIFLLNVKVKRRVNFRMRYYSVASSYCQITYI